MRTLLLSTAAVWLLALVSGCSHDAAADREPPAHVVEAPDPSVVAVEHGEQVARAKATERLLPNELRVTGVVVPDVARTVHVTSLGAGRLLELRVRLGDQVEKGQLLLTIRSPDLTAAIADYRKALADQRLSERALRRARDLFRNRALALKDLQQAENDAEKDAIDVEAARERIVLLGGDPDGLSPVIEVRAPIAGTIVEQNVAHGEAVKSLDSSAALLTLADLSRVWVLCDVYENNLADVHEGDRAEVRLNAYPDVPLAGTVGDIARVLDPATRTAKVRIELDNAQGLLRPGMFATARFESQVVTPHVVAPASAVLRLQDRSWVFRVEGPGRFRRTEVQAGRVLPDGAQEILAGLAPGDEVALDALALVGTASRT